MPDIRRTSLIDDFDRANANPAGPPWATVPGAANCQILGDSLAGTQNPPSTSTAYWTTDSFTSREMESWGETGGNAAFPTGWTMAQYTVASLALGTGHTTGYQCVFAVDPVSSSYQFRRWDNGTSHLIDSAVWDQKGGFFLIRRDPNDLNTIEFWCSDRADPHNPAATWELKCSASDSTYIDDEMRIVFGLISNAGETSWTTVGGGIRGVRRTQIYRIIRA